MRFPRYKFKAHLPTKGEFNPKPLRLYRGTTSDKGIDAMTKGLERGNWLTTSPTFAAGYAANQSIHKGTGVPVVLTVDVAAKTVKFMGRGNAFYGDWYVSDKTLHVDNMTPVKGRPKVVLK